MTGLSEKGQEIKVCMSLFFMSFTIYTVSTTHSISTSFPGDAGWPVIHQLFIHLKPAPDFTV